jgi:spore coat polysaccharide biosynthesis protein SpsF
MIGIVIQARLGSTRLPQKLIKPFYENKGVLELLVSKLKLEFHDVEIVVATSTNKKDDELVFLCEKIGVKCFRGDEENVLKRMVCCSEEHNFSKIIRLCADNPFLLISDIRKLITLGQKSDFDYISFKTANNTPTILTHYGFWTEFVKVESLRSVLSKTNDPFFLEHVTNYIYTMPSEFKINLLPIPNSLEILSDIRMTLDNSEDFIVLKEIYNLIPEFKELDDLLSFVVLNPLWLQVMREQIALNIKTNVIHKKNE